jgi:ribonuclease HI
MRNAIYDHWRTVSLPDDTPAFTLAFDGSCPANPGPMGIGYTLGVAGYAPLVRVGTQIGVGTNNIAEYEAMLAGMRHALRLGMWRLVMVTDSLLVANQYNDKWLAKDGQLARRRREAHMLANCFVQVPQLRHTFREANREADALSRQLVNDGPSLPLPPEGRSLLRWQAAAIRVWWHGRGVRSAAILAKVFGVQDVQIDQIVSGKAYNDATFAGREVWNPERKQGVRLPHHALAALPEPQDSVT